jgi:hypothetical protein
MRDGIQLDPVPSLAASSKNLPSFDDKYQRGTGVLDVFVGP